MIYKLLVACLTAITLSLSVGAETSELQSLNCTVRHAYGILGGFSELPDAGDTTIIDLVSITKNPREI